jgi:hypothetical protein
VAIGVRLHALMSAWLPLSVVLWVPRSGAGRLLSRGWCWLSFFVRLFDARVGLVGLALVGGVPFTFSDLPRAPGILHSLVFYGGAAPRAGDVCCVFGPWGDVSSVSLRRLPGYPCAARDKVLMWI